MNEWDLFCFGTEYDNGQHEASQAYHNNEESIRVIFLFILVNRILNKSDLLAFIVTYWSIYARHKVLFVFDCPNIWLIRPLADITIFSIIHSANTIGRCSYIAAGEITMSSILIQAINLIILLPFRFYPHDRKKRKDRMVLVIYYKQFILLNFWCFDRLLNRMN